MIEGDGHNWYAEYVLLRESKKDTSLPSGWTFWHPPPCPFCGVKETVKLPEPAFRSWRQGHKTPQQAFPELPPADIEILINGTHLECWDEVYGDPTGSLDSAAEAERGLEVR